MQLDVSKHTSVIQQGKYSFYKKMEGTNHPGMDNYSYETHYSIESISDCMLLLSQSVITFEYVCILDVISSQLGSTTVWGISIIAISLRFVSTCAWEHYMSQWHQETFSWNISMTLM